MCGLAGWIGKPPDPALMDTMLAPLHPRGPDARGQVPFENLHLGHTRLKVIDLEGGQQPMESKTSILVFNGEIYNYQELKTELEPVTGPFKSQSDTEVLQRALEHWGKDALSKIKGMFALAFYRRDNGSLMLARDPMGQKPLFYCHQGNTLVFASTTQSLRKHPDVPGQLNSQALGHYLIGESPKDPQTLYEHVFQVPSAHLLMFDGKTITLEPYWSWPEEQNELPPEEEAQTFDHLFRQAVSRRLRSDVPLGVFLSGGLDSSAVAWQMRHLLGQNPLATFSIGFTESSYDETSYSNLMAKQVQSEHHHEVLSEANVLEVLPKALEHFDQPLSDSSILPFYLLCEMTKRSVTVVLSGDGGDDIMGGYDPFKAIGWGQTLSWVPAFLTRPLRNALEKSRPRNNNLPWNFKGKQFLRGYRYRGGLAAAHWMSAWPKESIGQLLPQSPPLSPLWEKQFEDPYLDTMAYFRTRYMRDQILVKVDRASMAHALEVRCPLLDLDLVTFLSKRPWHRLAHPQGGKAPLRRWAQGKLPQNILTRPKKGFGMPIAQWLRGPLKDWVIDHITEDKLRDLHIQPKPVLALRDAHLSGLEDHRKEIWTMAVLCSWFPRR